MNKLKSDVNGGISFEWDDIRWEQDAVREALKGLMTFIGDDFILSGCQIVATTGTLVKVQAGYIVIDGEVCKVDESAEFDTATTPVIHIEVVSTYDSTGLETMENNVTVNTYEVRKAVPSAYATVQAGKLALASLKTAERLLNEKTQGYVHTYTALQSWAQGGAIAIGAGVNSVTPSSSEGNAFEVDISNANTALIRFGVAFSNGTLIALKFTGSAGSSITIEDNTGGNKPITTPGKVSAVFKVGEVALFWVIGGNYCLLNPFNVKPKWHEVGALGEPAFSGSWSGSLKFKLDPHSNQLAFLGSVSNTSYTTTTSDLIFVLPTGFRPLVDQVFYVHNTATGAYALVAVRTNGNVEYIQAGLSSATAGAYLNQVRPFTA